MRSMQQWLDDYGVSHQNGVNKLIHWVCVPAIFYSLIGLLSQIHIPWFDSYLQPSSELYFHVGTALIILGLFFYLRLSIPITLGMALFSIAVLYGVSALTAYVGWWDWAVFLAIFVLAWVGQFIGHKIEGQKPSFLEDLQFLMIGPAWLLHFLFKKWKIQY